MNPDSKVTFPDVAMKVAHDGPIYALLIVVGFAFFRGNASATEMVLTGAMSLLARMWPGLPKSDENPK